MMAEGGPVYSNSTAAFHGVTLRRPGTKSVSGAIYR
jgi:hypothetical protein